MRTKLRRGEEPRSSLKVLMGATLVDYLAPAVVVLYVVLQFEPFVEIIRFPGALSSVGFSGAAIGVLIITPRDRLVRVPISVSFLSLLGWAVISMSWSLYPRYTAVLIRGQLVPIFLLMLVAGTIPTTRMIRTLLAVLGAIALSSLVTSVVWESGRSATVDLGVDQLGFRGGFDHKNLLGVFMIMGLAAALPLLRPPLVTRRLRLLVVAVLVVTALATRSATAAGGLAVVGTLWVWLASTRLVRTPGDRRRLMAFSLAAVVVGVTVVIGALPALLSLYDKDLTFSGRTTIWRESLVTVGDRPFIGYGYGGLFRGPLHPVTEDLWERIEFAVPHAHNGIIEIALGLGVIGVGLASLAVFQCVRVGVRCLRHEPLARLGQWVLLTTVSIFVMSMAEPLLQGPHLAWLGLIWTVAARAHRDFERGGVSLSPDRSAPSPRVVSGAVGAWRGSE